MKNLEGQAILLYRPKVAAGDGRATGDRPWVAFTGSAIHFVKYMERQGFCEYIVGTIFTTSDPQPDLGHPYGPVTMGDLSGEAKPAKAKRKVGFRKEGP